MAFQFTYLKDGLGKEVAEKTEAYERLMRVDPPGHITSVWYKDWADKIRQFEVKEDDVWIITYPKAGTTWTQEMVWAIMKNDLSFSSPEACTDILLRFPFLEYDSIFDPTEQDQIMAALPHLFHGKQWERVQTQPSPRLIKTHLPYELLPLQLWTKKPKILYVARNVKDLMISRFHHFIGLEGFTGSLEEFVHYFINDMIPDSPYWPHVKKFWQMKDEKNIIFIKYEDMKKNLHCVAKKVAQFLGKPLNEDQLDTLVENLSIEAMKKRGSVGYDKVSMSGSFKFLRKGKVGGWKEELPEELRAKVDEWISKELQDTNLTFEES